jgi:hypothetical protein
MHKILMALLIVFKDHSGTGNRNMLMIGHSESTSEKVWYKTITVTPNTDIFYLHGLLLPIKIIKLPLIGK